MLLTNDVQEDQVLVSPEIYEVYVEMGTTFQACKICTDRDKDTRIEPCGHLICSVCVNKWMNHDRNHSCPFCRREIKGTSSVRVEISRSHTTAGRPSSRNTRAISTNQSSAANQQIGLLTLGGGELQRTESTPDLPTADNVRKNLL